MTHPLPDKAVEAGLARFNEVINDPIMEPCAKCSGKGYHHGFGPGGVEPDWCTDCGGNQFNIRPGEELRAMQAAIETALAAEGLCVVPAIPSEAMWGGLARDIVMWTRFARPTCASLLDHLRSVGRDIPEWLAAECRHQDVVPPKGSVAVWVYRAMIEAAREG